MALYAAEIESGTIRGSTTRENIGKNLSDIGIPTEKIHLGTSSFYASVNMPSAKIRVVVTTLRYMEPFVMILPRMYSDSNTRH